VLPRLASAYYWPFPYKSPAIFYSSPYCVWTGTTYDSYCGSMQGKPSSEALEANYYERHYAVFKGPHYYRINPSKRKTSVHGVQRFCPMRRIREAVADPLGYPLRIRNNFTSLPHWAEPPRLVHGRFSLYTVGYNPFKRAAFGIAGLRSTVTNLRAPGTTEIPYRP